MATQTRYVFVIEVHRCIDCKACMVACDVEHAITPGYHRNWVRAGPLNGVFPDLRQDYLAGNCMACEHPPCVDACPTGASYRRSDGLVLIDHEKCVGCRFCMAACPYDARYYDEARGTVDKCSACVHRLESGLIPACVETCVGGARHFGDINDPAGDVARLYATGLARPFHPETGTGPSVFYLSASGRTDSEFPVDRSPADLVGFRRHLESPVALSMIGAAIGITGIAFKSARRNAAEHFQEVEAEAMRKVGPDDGPIPRYNVVQRIGHWANALAFLSLLITGLFLFLWPLSPLAGSASRLIHRIAAVVLFLGPLCYLAADRAGFLHLLRASFTYSRDDLIWFLKSPVYFLGIAKGLPPQGKINAGQRVHHALTIIFYNLIAVSGLLMWFGAARIPKRLFLGSLLVHDVSMSILTVLLVGHIYFTFVYGALDGMIKGTISRVYAQIEHPRWLQDLAGKTSAPK